MAYCARYGAQSVESMKKQSRAELVALSIQLHGIVKAENTPEK